MFQRNYASSTANTYVSALGYYHRLAGVPDPTKVFWVLEMLKGYGKLGSRLDTRMPITLSILRIVLQQTSTQPRTQGLSLEKTLASAGHVTLIKVCSRGRVGESRIYNYPKTPCCRIRSAGFSFRVYILRS